MKIIKLNRKKQRVWIYPSAIERDYVKYLRSIADTVLGVVNEKLPEIAPHFERNQRQDGLADILQDWLETLLQAVLPLADNEAVKSKVERLLSQTATHNKQQFGKVLKQAYGVNIFVTEPFLADSLALAGLENLRLIKSLPVQYVEQLRSKITEAVRSGRRWEDLAAEMKKTLPEKLHRRAELIARDQIGKLNAQLTKQRQQNIGVKQYIWRGMLDERERQSHVDREGQIFDWDNPPDDGHPGQAILCRCYSEALLPEFEDVLEQKHVVAADGEPKYNPAPVVEKPKVDVLPKASQESLSQVVKIGKAIHDKHKDLIKQALVSENPHEMMLEIMKREGVELGGKVDVLNVSKKEVASALDFIKSIERYPKSWVEETNKHGRIWTKEVRNTVNKYGRITRYARAYQSAVEQGYRLPNEFGRYGKVGIVKKGKEGIIRNGDTLITINMSKPTVNDILATDIHEFGHKLQRNILELDNYFTEFWRARTKGLPTERLRDITNLDYDIHEKTKKDHFPNPYYGKIYEINGAEKPLEMLTMTFESIIGGNKQRFIELYEKDPELFNFGLALLTRFKL